MTTNYSALYFEYQDVSSGASAVPIQINILNASGVASNYQLAYGGWAPNISKRKINLLSGSISYENVEEELTLNIIGTTAALCINRLQTLLNVLDQADRWYDNQRTTPVRVWYQPKGSNAALVYNSLVLGNRSSDDWAQLPVTFDEVGQIYRIDGVTIKFLRVGLWYQSNTSNTANTGSTPVCNLGSITLPGPNSNLYSPCDATFGVFVTASIPLPVPASLLIVTNRNKATNTTNLGFINAGGLATTVKYTLVNDAARLAANTSILRYTPTDILYNESLYSNVIIGGNVFAVYATLRNNSTTTTFKVKMTCASSTSATSASVARSTTQETYIDASIQTPRVVFLGTLTRTGPSINFNVTIQASAASGSIDFDAIFIVAIDDETTSIIELPQMHFTNEIAAGTHNIGFYANQGYVAYGTPFFGMIPTRAMATMSITAVNTALAVNGLLPITVVDSHLDIIWVCVAANSVDKWVYVNNANTPLSTTFTITERHSAYLIPE